MRDLGAHKCPVCGKFEFDHFNSYDFCEVCDWCDDGYQEMHPDETGFSSITVNEAKENFANTGNAYGKK